MKFRYAFLLIIFLGCYYLAPANEHWDTYAIPQHLRSSGSNAITKAGHDYLIATKTKGIIRFSEMDSIWLESPAAMQQQDIKILKSGPMGFIIAINAINTVYYSTDFGENWKDDQFFVPDDFEIFCLDYDSKGYVYVGTNYGLYKSTDYCQSWNNISQEFGKSTVRALKIDSQDRIYISLEGDVTGFYKSENYGSKWTPVNTGLPMPCVATKLYKNEQDVIFASVNYGKPAANLYGFYFTIDNGASWSKLEKNFEKLVDFDITKVGNVVIYDGNRMHYYDITKKQWLDDDRRVVSGKDIVGLIMDDGYVVAVTDSTIKISADRIDDILETINAFDWIVNVVNHNNQPVRNTTLNVFRKNKSLLKPMGAVTTDENGRVTLPSEDYSTFKEVLFTVEDFFIPSDKKNHQDVENRKYYLRLDNMEITKDGKVQFFTLKNKTGETTRLAHTVVRPSFVVSVQWDASDEQLDSICKYFRHLSNYFFDVTNGQMILDKVCVLDNAKYWDDADLQIYASNMVWPCADVNYVNSQYGHVYFPRKWYGNGDDNRNFTASDDWLSTYNDYTYTTYGHELGHYFFGFFDEYVYVDTNKAKQLPEGYNYGFMDYQYPNGDQYYREMSNMDMYPNYMYKITAQWDQNSSDCWTQFKNTFSAKKGDLIFSLREPKDYNVSTILGPNKDSIDFNAGKYLQASWVDHISDAGNFGGICKTVNGSTADNAHTFLTKGTKRIYQGKTADDGGMIFLGAEVGDYAYVTYTDKDDFTYYINKYKVNYVTTTANNKNPTMQSAETIELKPISGKYSLVNTLRYGGDFPVITSNFNNDDDLKPVIRYESAESGSEVIPMTHDTEDASKYHAGLTFSRTGSSEFTIYCSDRNSLEFPIPGGFVFYDTKRLMNSAEGRMLLNLDTNDAKRLQTTAILTTEFFPLMDGIQEGAEFAGPMFSVASSPESATYSGNNIIAISYAKSDLKKGRIEDLRIYGWNETEKHWKLIGGRNDTVKKIVQCIYPGNGTYALFTYDPGSGTDDDGMNIQEFNVCPNPVSEKSSVRFYLAKPGDVGCGIYDLLGRKVVNVFEGRYFDAGYNTFDIQRQGLEPGVYIIELKMGTSKISSKIVVI